MDQLSRFILQTVGQLMQLLGVVTVVLHHIGQQRQRFLRGVVLMVMVMGMGMIMRMGVSSAVGMGVFMVMAAHRKALSFVFFYSTTPERASQFAIGRICRRQAFGMKKPCCEYP